MNLNDNIKVKLTETGKTIIMRYVMDLFKGHESQVPSQYERLTEKDNDGYTRFQLHVFMSLFGNHCYNDNMIPFIEKNEIIIE